MRTHNDDKGAVTVFIAITIAVLLGMAGLVVDIGAMYHERRQLQNGADAAALAIAEACARGETGCTPGTAKALAKAFADANAADGHADVAGIDIDFTNQTVTVSTSTLNADGSTNLEPSFAGVLGFNGSTIAATAVAQWGHPKSLFNFLPLIISWCEIEDLDLNDPENLPTAADTIYFHSGNNQNPCRGPAGQDADGEEFMPGGFGWLDTPKKACEDYMESGTWVGVEPGNSPTPGCSPAYVQSLTSKPIPLPIYTGIKDQGRTAEFYLDGFAYFHITGYNFGGQFKLNPPCTGDDRCVRGYFTSGVIYDGDFGGDGLGISIVKLIG
jgi:hypothetical protein